MNNHPAGCEYEDAVTNALLSGHDDASLRRHCESCEVCRDVMISIEYLALQSRQTVRETPFPTADYLLWRSRIRSGIAFSRRATMPIAAMERTISFLITVALIALVLFQSLGLQALLSGASLAVSRSWAAGVVFSGAIVLLTVTLSTGFALRRRTR